MLAGRILIVFMTLVAVCTRYPLPAGRHLLIHELVLWNLINQDFMKNKKITNISFLLVLILTRWNT